MSKELRQKAIEKLAGANLRRLESLGQNFLIDKEMISRICQAVLDSKPDVVLEIGPGLGAVTFALAPALKRLVAVELDRGLAAGLAKEGVQNLEVVQGDIIKQDLAELGLFKRKYTAFGSLPFNMGTAIIRYLLENENPPKKLYVILQQEVIDRILAKDGQETILSLAVRFFGSPQQLLRIPRSAYQPIPRVDTGLLVIDCSAPPSEPALQKPFFSLIKAGFSARRKFLSANLAAKLKIPRKTVNQALKELPIDPKIRAEALSYADWLKLARNSIFHRNTG